MFAAPQSERGDSRNSHLSPVKRERLLVTLVLLLSILHRRVHLGFGATSPPLARGTWDNGFEEVRT